jgi:hypothetical protein
MAGLVPAIHVLVELNRLRENCQTGKALLLQAFAAGGANVGLVIETARRGWPGQAPAMTVEALRRGRNRLAKTQGVLV